MAAMTESDLENLKNLIRDRFDELEKGQIEIKGQIAVIDARLKSLETSSQKIPDLAEKIGELKHWNQIAWLLGGALLGGAIVYFLMNAGTSASWIE
jgi:hypothetical protein